MAAEFHAPSSALPIGAAPAVGDTQLVEIDPNLPRSSPLLLNAVLALLQAEDDAEEEEVMRSPVLGYVHVFVFCHFSLSEFCVAETEGPDSSGIDVNRKKFTVLSPVAGRLPRNRAIVASLEWLDA
jgi:polyribonucleotide 5'-hydroxyl-kinase